MTKDLLDEGRTQEPPLDAVAEHQKGSLTIADIVEAASSFPEIAPFEVVETLVEPVPEAEPEFKSTLSPEAAEAAQKAIRGRSFSGRNVRLGKMINCRVCGERHRENRTITYPSGKIEILPKCEQKFTNVSGEFEYYREDPGTGTLVPDLRTVVSPDTQPTPRQIMGAAVFAKRRKNPHPSAVKLQLIERTRAVFAEMGFTITESKNPEIQKQAHLNMAIARKEALRRIINERRARRVRARNQTKLSRRVNWGLTK